MATKLFMVLWVCFVFFWRKKKKRTKDKKKKYPDFSGKTVETPPLDLFNFRNLSQVCCYSVL